MNPDKPLASLFLEKYPFSPCPAARAVLADPSLPFADLPEPARALCDKAQEILWVAEALNYVTTILENMLQEPSEDSTRRRQCLELARSVLAELKGA